MDKNKGYFDLPLEAKNVAAHPEQPNPHRGYSYVGQENLSRVKDFEKGVRNTVQVYDTKVIDQPPDPCACGLTVADVIIGVLRSGPSQRYYIP